MNDLTFTRDDINALTERLGEFATNLNKSEWGLLLAIFAAAADHVETGADETQGKFSGVGVTGKEPTVDDPTGKTAKELRDLLRKAYVPGKPPKPIRDKVTPIKPGGGP